jgi:hypothetical protein
MSNDPESEPPRFYVEQYSDGDYYVYDRDDLHDAQGPFFDREEAVEHAKELNSMFKG